MPRADAPDVQVMHVQDATHACHACADFLHRKMFRHALDQNVQRRFQHAPRTEHDDDADEHAHQRVHPLPARQPDYARRHDDAHCGDRVADDVQEGAADIEVFGLFVRLCAVFACMVMFMLVSAEDEGDDEIDDQPDDGGDQHFHVFHGLRVEPAMPGFAEDFDGNLPSMTPLISAASTSRR